MTPADHARALKRIEVLMDTAHLTEAEEIELDTLAKAVEKYEDKEFPI